MEKVRIQKALAEAGVASRRAVEEMVVEGRIEVNGELVNALPCFVDPERDDIRIDGQPVKGKRMPSAYFLLNKPRGAVCTQSDSQGRPLASTLVPTFGGRVYCVGGLDEDCTGLVILTNDGELTRTLTDSRNGLEMTYLVEVDGRPDEQTFIALKNGIFLDGRRTGGYRVKILSTQQNRKTGSRKNVGPGDRKPKDRRSGITLRSSGLPVIRTTGPSASRSMLEIHTLEGRNRTIRRVFHRLGHKVRRLKRIAIGPVSERGLKIGHFRMLLPREVEQLRRGRIKRDREPEDRETGRRDTGRS